MAPFSLIWTLLCVSCVHSISYEQWRNVRKCLQDIAPLFERKLVLIIHETHTHIHTEAKKRCLCTERNVTLSVLTIPYFSNSLSWTIHLSNQNYSRPSKHYHLFQMEKSKADHIVILVENELQAGAVVKLATQNAMWNGRRKILVMADSSGMSDAAISAILLLFWKTSKAVNVTLMWIGFDDVRFFTLFPYHERLNPQAKLIATCNQIHMDHSRLYPEKLPKNFNACNIDVATTPNPPYVARPTRGPIDYEKGIEIEMMRTIAKFYNFKITFKSSPPGEFPWSVVSSTGAIIGLTGLLYRQEADVAMWGCRLSIDRYYLVEALQSHTEDSFVWVVPTPGPAETWNNIYIAFPIEIWIIIGVFILLVTATFDLIANVQHDARDQTSFVRSLLDVWSITLNVGLSRVPSTTLLRLFTISFFLYAFNIATAYQTYLVTLLTAKRHTKPIETPEEGIDSGLTAYIFPSGRPSYNQTHHRFWNKVLSPGRHVYENNAVISLKVVSVDRTAMTLYNKNGASYIVEEFYLKKKNEKLIRFLSPKFSNFDVTMYVSPGNPLKHILNNKTRQMIESGLIQRWLKDLEVPTLAVDYMSMDKKFEALSVFHLRVVFAMLAGLLAFSFFVFLCELLRWKWSKRKARKQTEQKRQSVKLGNE